MPTILGICGNPAPRSKTLRLTRDVLTALADRLETATDVPAPTEVIDLSALGGKVMTWGDTETDAARDRLRTADLVVVATPVYKGAYTGLLKGFLDGYGAGDLAGALAVPLTVAASPAHALAGPTHLEPVLTELGMLAPGGTLHVPDKIAADPEAARAVIDTWLDTRLALFRTVTDAPAAVRTAGGVR